VTSATNDVVVVGCGSVGLGSSMLLAQRGLAVTILEHQPEPCRWITAHNAITTLARQGVLL
jgi:2-polyprenyl-6-methoxyphenol hydroxylase-like FAD-dependent oxidoreductase